MEDIEGLRSRIVLLEQEVFRRAERLPAAVAMERIGMERAFQTLQRDVDGLEARLENLEKRMR